MGESASAKIVKPYLETSLVKRIDWIDFLKAFAIFLVVWGHSIHFYFTNLDSLLYSFIVTFNMPLFAIISGLFFRSDVKGGRFVSTKFRTLILPLIVWSFIVSVGIRGIHEIYLHFTDGYNIHFKSWAEGWFMYIVFWGWWFLRALFLCFVYAYFSVRIVKRNETLGIVGSILLLYLLSLSGIIPNKVQHDFIFLYPFFCVGILIKTFQNYIEKFSNKLLVISSITFLICLLFWQGHDDTFYVMNTSMTETVGKITGIHVLYKTLLRFTIGVSGSMMFLLLAKSLQRYKIANKYILYVGKNTLAIYIVHTVIIDICSDIPPHIPTCSNGLSIILSISLSFILILFCYWFAKITGKSRWLNFLLWGKVRS